MSAFILISIELVENLTLFSGIILIILSAIIYFSFLLLIKGITKEDFVSIQQVIKKR
jgi:hypothetical protein